MIYHKFFWIAGLVFIVVAFMGISQGRIISGAGFFPIALSALVAYDKYNPKVRFKSLRDALFIAGLVLAFVIWYFGPKFFPNLH